MTQKTYGEYPAETFKLPEDPESFVVVRQASFGAERRIAQQWAGGEVTYRDEGHTVTRRQETTVADVRALEIFLTFEDSNIQGPNDKPLFKKNMNESAFMVALDMLPASIVRWWSECVREVNPDWAPKSEGEA